MPCIQDELFYHIQRNNSSLKPWQLNDVEFIGSVKNPFYSMYDSFIVSEPVDLPTLLGEYVTFAREVIFEEVRQQYFPNLPSRQTCLWIIPHDEVHLNYWTSKLCTTNSHYQILELRCSGKIFYANETFLTPILGGFNQFRENAFKYWSGINANANSVNVECLFQGFIHVEQVIKPFD